MGAKYVSSFGSNSFVHLINLIGDPRMVIFSLKYIFLKSFSKVSRKMCLAL